MTCEAVKKIAPFTANDIRKMALLQDLAAGRTQLVLVVVFLALSPASSPTSGSGGGVGANHLKSHSVRLRHSRTARQVVQVAPHAAVQLNSTDAGGVRSGVGGSGDADAEASSSSLSTFLESVSEERMSILATTSDAVVATDVYSPKCHDGLKEVAVLRIAVLLPTAANCEADENDPLYYNQMEKVLPAIFLAADVNNTYHPGYVSPLKGILPGWKFEVWHSDTQCSSTYGPLESFKLHCTAGNQHEFNIPVGVL